VGAIALQHGANAMAVGARGLEWRVPHVRDRIRRIALPPFDPLNARAAELRAEGHAVIALGQAVPDFPPPPSALAAARAAVDTPEINRYVTDPGLPSLRRALAGKLSALASAPDVFSSQDIVITAGANHAFTLMLNTIVDAGDEVVVHSPYFTNHHGAILAAGATPIEAPVADRNRFAVRWTDIAPRLSPRTRAVVLCNPSNPTGAPVAAVDGVEIVTELARRGVFVISDETYMHFVYEGKHWSAASVECWRDNVIVIGTFSKSFGMMGWRLGFVLADPGICTEAIKVQDAMIICAPAIAQVAGEAAVHEDWDYATRFHHELRARRQTLADGLSTIPGVHWTPTAGGLFAFVRIDRCHDSTELAGDLLERAHVVTIPGAAFGPPGEGYLRISYGYASQAELTEAVRRLATFFART
jgi:aminotransferase